MERNRTAVGNRAVVFGLGDGWRLVITNECLCRKVHIYEILYKRKGAHWNVVYQDWVTDRVVTETFLDRDSAEVWLELMSVPVTAFNWLAIKWGLEGGCGRLE